MQEEKNNSILLSWTAPEFIKHEKSAGWFWALGIIGVALVVVSLMMQNYLFILIVILAAFLIYIQAKKRPTNIRVTLTNKGIIINDKEYAYSDLRSFWIFEEPEIECLSLISKKLTQPQIQIPFGEQNPKKIREILIKFITEKEQEEPLIDAIARKIKF
jgi:hypothetical protein